MKNISVLIKPASGACNMTCDYCFYCDEAAKREQKFYGMMSEETLKNMIRRTMLHSEGSVSYTWQGGEPTLRGLDFFRKALYLQKKYNRNHLQVINAFQTNGYDNEGNVSPEGVQSLTKYFVEKGVKGVYVNGSSGECIYQSVEDRKIILENVMKAAEGKLTVIAHVACNNTKDSQELARHAESLGVDAIAAIPPIYFHLPEYAIAQYWNDISAAAPNTDFVIYNIPQLAGVALTQGLFAEMRKNPNVIGVKNSSMPVQDIQMFKQAAGPDYIIFNGPDEQFMSGRVIGAEGAIGGTYGVMPELYLKLDEYVRAGKMEEAREIQYACDEIIYKMCSAHGNMYAVIKAILKINEGLELGGVKEPLPGLIDEDSDIVKKAAQMICDAKKKYL